MIFPCATDDQRFGARPAPPQKTCDRQLCNHFRRKYDWKFGWHDVIERQHASDLGGIVRIRGDPGPHDHASSESCRRPGLLPAG